MIAPTIHAAPEIEVHALGAIFFGGHEGIDAAERIINADDFTDSRRAAVYQALRQMRKLGKPFEFDLLAQHMKDTGTLESVGGRDWLFDLVGSVANAASLEHYCKTIRGKGDQRRRVAITERMHLAAVEGAGREELARMAADAFPVTEENNDTWTIEEIMLSHPTSSAPVVHGLLRRGEVMTSVGLPKSRKSWNVGALLACVANGNPSKRRQWLGFDVEQGQNVLAVDLELKPSEFHKRFSRVLEGLGLNLDDTGGRVRAMLKRGTAFTIDDFEAASQRWKPGDFALIAIDALYKMYPRDFNENDNALMAELVSRLIVVAERLECAIVLVHHQPKNSAGRSVVDSGAGAGSLARAVDVHSVLTVEEADPDAATFAAVVRSFKPFPPRRLRWQNYVYVPDDHAPEIVTNWTPQTLADRCVGADPLSRAAVVGVAMGLGATERAAKRLLGQAVAQGLVKQVKIKGERGDFYTLPKEGIVNERALYSARTLTPPGVDDKHPPRVRGMGCADSQGGES